MNKFQRRRKSLRTDLLQMTINELRKMMPWIEDYFSAFAIDPAQLGNRKLEELGSILGEDYFIEMGSSSLAFTDGFFLFIEQARALQQGSGSTVESLTVLLDIIKMVEKRPFR